MKTRLFFITVLILFSGLFLSPIYSQETPIPTLSTDKKPTSIQPTITKNDGNVKLLKEKIATKVAELSKENRRAFSGYITKEHKDATLKIKTDDDRVITISAENSVTQTFSLVVSTDKKKVELGVLKKGDYITAIGVFIDNTLTANMIYVQPEIVVGSGTITDIDKKKFTIDLVTSEKDQLTLDIEKNTVEHQIDTKKLKIITSGFSNFTVGDMVHYLIEKEKKDDARSVFSAQRILLVPQSILKKESK